MFHVGMIDVKANSLVYHEETEDENRARLRLLMFDLQAGLDMRDHGRERSAFLTDTWPPEGMTAVNMESLPVRAVEGVALEAELPEEAPAEETAEDGE
jgi:hypothetical protein